MDDALGGPVDEVVNLEEEFEVRSFNENLDGQIRDEVFKFLDKSNLETITKKDVKKHIKKIFGKQVDSSLIKKFIKEYQRAQAQQLTEEEQNIEPLEEEEIPEIETFEEQDDEEIPELEIEGLDDF